MGEILIGLALIGLGLVIYIRGGNLPSLNEAFFNAGSFPRLIAGLLILLSIILILSKLNELRKRKPVEDKVSNKERMSAFYAEYRLVILTTAVFFVYIFLLQFIGFVVSTILFIIGAAILIGYRKRKEVVTISAVAVILTLTIYFFFENVLHVRFPSGIFI
ncbi:tripartite tricarboxylate transporter TctB family protein [Planococcus sp. X10-3]|uniref:tripartite tricarboxylate transporter TctB family protein n=1 Tax=Planococcus sp. X10-3 TaxID=3061240 RepID=UPI003BB01C72